MAKRLLHRQVRLIKHLTSAGAIFGEGSSLDHALRGIDPALLRIEARFSHEKRMEKIGAVFPRTIGMLGADRERIVTAFVEACPPVDIGRIENARQFHEFLSSRWRREPPMPPYLPDVAACELACATCRLAAERRELKSLEGAAEAQAVRSGIRRQPGIALLRSRYDIRPIFEIGLEHAAPIKHSTPLAVTWAAELDEPRIFEVTPEVFDLLAALDEWTDPATFAASREARELIADLAKTGLVEVRP